MTPTVTFLCGHALFAICSSGISPFPARRSSAVTAPITMTAGAVNPCEEASAGSLDSTVLIHRCRFVVPSIITAQAVSGLLPAASSPTTIFARWCIPIRTTSVPSSLASVSKSIRRRSCPSVSAAVPVTTVTLAESPLCVTGMPAAAGTAIAEDIPGISSQHIPAFCSARNSSPPLPNT